MTINQGCKSPPSVHNDWQGGYAGFSVSQSNLDRVGEWILRQAEHHRKVSFQDNLRALLRKLEMESDERCLWD